jgi:hypothetical protein
MQSVFADELYESVIIWIDDLVLYASDDEEYLEKLRSFFMKLRKHNLKLSASKSTIYAKSVTWCGHVIDGDGMQQDPTRVQALSTLPLPTSSSTFCAPRVGCASRSYVRTIAAKIGHRTQEPQQEGQCGC